MNTSAVEARRVHLASLVDPSIPEGDELRACERELRAVSQGARSCGQPGRKWTVVAYLSRLCARWGGELVMLPECEFNRLDYESARGGVSGSPDGWQAVDIPGRRVITTVGHVCPGCILHEMGHLFLVEAEPDMVPDEWAWFGWEISLARKAQCYAAWSRSSRLYVVEGDRDWQDLKPHEKRRMIADRIDHAKKIGIVSPEGDPLCTRHWP